MSGVAAVLVAVAVAVWLVAGVRLAVIDYRTGRLPTRLIWPTAGIVWVLYAAASLISTEPGGLIGAVLGAAACGAFIGCGPLHPSALAGVRRRPPQRAERLAVRGGGAGR